MYNIFISKMGYFMEEAVLLREKGKGLLSSNDVVEFRQGIDYIVAAHRGGDREATFLVARLMIDGYLKFEGASSSEESGIQLMYQLANGGDISARVFLNRYCQKRYESYVVTGDYTGKLKDFSGKEIVIDRKGVFTPIDARLEYKDGKNTLYLEMNLKFISFSDIPELNKIAEAVTKGIKMWQGEYEVFGGQKLSVRVKTTFKKRIFDNVNVMLMDDVINGAIMSIGNKINNYKLTNIAKNKRSFAHGLRWSARSRKTISLYYNEGNVINYDEIAHTMKHEFGHLLGLGDLYEEQADGRQGVEKGTFYELDGYNVSDRIYNLVMCSHYGVISNNDIEMVVLAFMENKRQDYQKINNKGKVSKALGRGN